MTRPPYLCRAHRWVGLNVLRFVARAFGFAALLRLADLRLDLREGSVRESSRVATMPRCRRLVLRRVVLNPPARRSLADTAELLAGRAAR